MKKTVSILFLLSIALFFPTVVSAQKIMADKTTEKGRMILLEEKRYFGSDRGDEISLSYYSSVKDGGEVYLFGAKVKDMGQILLKCRKKVVTSHP